MDGWLLTGGEQSRYNTWWDYYWSLMVINWPGLWLRHVITFSCKSKFMLRSKYMLFLLCTSSRIVFHAPIFSIYPRYVRLGAILAVVSCLSKTLTHLFYLILAFLGWEQTCHSHVRSHHDTMWCVWKAWSSLCVHTRPGDWRSSLGRLRCVAVFPQVW